MSRRLSDNERRLWGRVARTVRAVPRRRVEEDDAPPAAEPKGDARPASAAPETPAPKKRKAAPGPLADVGGERKVRRGQTEIEARLDLHGHTQDTGRAALVDFVLRSQAMGARCVLVITGKGRMGGGVLRSRFFDWIEGPEIRPVLAGYSRAHQRHGGEGAFYLLIKAKREP